MLVAQGRFIYYDGMEQKTKEQVQSEQRRLLKAELLFKQKKADEEVIRLAQLEIAARAIAFDSPWQSQALCSASQVNPEIFDVLPKDSDAIERAKRYCGACAVQSACLEYALNSRNLETELVWGGETPDERRATRRRTARYNSSRRS